MATICINPGCGQTEELTTASLSMKRFFGMKRHCVGQSEGVCIACLGLYDQSTKEQPTKVKTLNPVLHGLLQLSSPEFGDYKEKEADSEDEKPTEPADVMEVDSEDELVFEFDEELDLDDEIAASLERLDFHLQIKNATFALDNKLKGMQPEFDETDDLFEKLEEQVEQLKADFEQLAGLDSAPASESDEVDLENSLFPSDPQKLRFGIANYSPYHPQKQQNANENSNKNNNSSKIDSDVIPVGRVSAPPRPALPPSGPITRWELVLGMRVYAMKASYFGIWYKARIMEIKNGPPGEGKQYKVRFEPKRMAAHTRILSGKHLAYVDSASVILPVGTRIIAQYRDEHWSQANSMYAGIIAEPPKIMNQYRYLVFFDDGYAQYITHSQIHLVCEVSKDVWDDIHPDSKEFIRSYLQQYPERPMVKLQQGQVVKTEWNGKWWIARVVEVDASLVKMYFDADKRTEWIYRGSTRLGPLFSELANAEANKATGKLKRHNLGMSKRKNGPYVEYTRGLDESPRNEVGEQAEDEVPQEDGSLDAEAEATAETEVDEPSAELATLESDEEDSQHEKRQVAKKHTSPTVPSQPSQRPNVAKKSTGGSAAHQSQQQQPHPPPTARSVANRPVLHPESDGVYEPRYSQHVEYRKRFVPHRCSSSCLATASDHPAPMKGKNPLLIPMLFGWERQMAKFQTVGKRSVLYRAPCGRRLRCLEEVHSYLLATQSQLSIDLFCFDIVVHCFGEFVPSTAFCFIKDISYGKENVPVTCVNSINRQYPEYVEYSTRRLPAKGVHLNLEPEFLVGCDCTDDCSDPSKCLCQQLTQSAASDYSGYYNDFVVGYKHRRLTEGIVTGIYECNSRCKCRSQCQNRVVQNGLQLRLQVFKTEKRGWGLRCLDDVPHGCFICIYAGQLLTDEGANEDGTQYGDEYLAELDYIEVVEKLKEGYESDVVDPDEEDENEKQDDEKTVASEGSEEVENGSEDEEELNSDSSHNPDAAEENSSDSDFEMSMTRPVVPREKSSRTKQKVDKLTIHKEKVRKRKCHRYSEKSSMKEEEPSTPTSPSAKSNPEEVPGHSRGFLRDIPQLSPTTLEELSHSKLIRRPRMSRGTSENSSHQSDSDTEDASKASSMTTTCDTADTEADEHKKPRQPSRFNILPDPKKPDRTEPVSPPATKGPSDEQPPVKFQSVRRYFGEEYCYIMDAKSIGNIGRYLNHSCAPNVFVQNVFVDTHDLRFPWVAFFAMQFIRAGTELTWDYNYDVGSVPGKVLYCHCTAPECRGRLL